MKTRVGIISLGCPKNLVDTEIMLGLLNESEYKITNNEDDAEIIIVNTCGFIESAKQESIDTILEAAQYKENKCRLLIVTGCLAQRYKQDIITEIPEVDAVIGTGNYADIVSVIHNANSENKTVITDSNIDIGYLENKRIFTNNSGYAYVKISEGCDNCCTYCIIPKLRGPYKSRKMEDIEKEVCHLAQKGIKEVILIAQDTTRYGIDLYNKKRIVQLIRNISKVDGIEWIRMLYCYPEEIGEDLIDEIAQNDKICKYIDIPIQHISPKILKAMGRRGNEKDIKHLIEELRQKIPGIIIRTSLIVGFPGEDENDFRDLYEFVENYKLDRLGVFTYSREEDTVAAEFGGQINNELKLQRFNSIMKLQNQITRRKNSKRLGSNYKTLVHGVSDDGIFYYGRTYAEAPDIDGTIYFTSEYPLRAGTFVDVKILEVSDYDLIGEVINEFTE